MGKFTELDRGTQLSVVKTFLNEMEKSSKKEQGMRMNYYARHVAMALELMGMNPCVSNKELVPELLNVETVQIDDMWLEGDEIWLKGDREDD